VKETLLQLAEKADRLARRARIQDILLFLDQPELDRVQKISAVVHALDAGAYLLGTGPYTQGVYSVMSEEVVLGRLATPLETPLDKPVDIFCQDIVSLVPREVSRCHARISRLGEQTRVYFIEDLGSACGTFLNGRKLGNSDAEDQKLSPTELSSGDVISLGPSLINTFIFVDLR
jgi:FHA domain